MSTLDDASSVRGFEVDAGRQKEALNVERLHILIVEDDVDQRSLICETLQEKFGSDSVTCVGSLREALELDLAVFDLILADYNLPDASGLELLDQIKRRTDTPVIMVTGENVGQIAVEAIRKGAADYIVKLGDYLFTIPVVVEKNLTIAKIQRENFSLRRKLELALTQLQDKNLQLEESLSRMQQMAATDPLTSLYNRRHFGRVLEQMFAESQRYQADLACVMIDLDEYKRLNDKYGHQVGDQLLILAGKVISANMRRMDVAARYGGDEFVLLLPRASAQEAEIVAQRIREEFAQAAAAALRSSQGITMSVGIASLVTNQASSADQLVAQADKALYGAKNGGRDRVVAAVIEKTQGTQVWQ
ncbi:MAG TPA: diguanylate cyclase [Tepidisphaeraceae bacterium]|jgi:two-component system cell cycle response regulator